MSNIDQVRLVTTDKPVIFQDFLILVNWLGDLLISVIKGLCCLVIGLTNPIFEHDDELTGV